MLRRRLAAALSDLLKNYSTDQPAGKAKAECPKKEKTVPVKHCNLESLMVTEPLGEPSGKPGVRTVEYRKNTQRNRRVSPIQLPSGSTIFEITAMSRYIRPPVVNATDSGLAQVTELKAAAYEGRLIHITVKSECQCSTATHPLLMGYGDDNADTIAKAVNEADLRFYRPPLVTDQGMVNGFWAFLNAAYLQIQSPAVYSLSALSCGIPAKSGGCSVEQLSGKINVYPADQFVLKLSIPAFLKADVLTLSSESWKTEADRKKEQQRLAKAERQTEADRYYQSYWEFLKEAKVSRADVRRFVEDMAKKESGEVDERWFDSVKDDFELTLTQTDGERIIEAPVQDIIQMIRCIRKAEHRLKQLEKWFDNVQVGLGCQFKIDLQLFAGKARLSWGHEEYIDERVFLKCSAEVEIEILKLTVDFVVGFRLLGAVDAVVDLKGEGTLGFKIEKFITNSPDTPEPKITPYGDVELSGKLIGQLFWRIKGEFGIKCEFKAEISEFKVLSKHKAFGGVIKVRREAVKRFVTASNGVEQFDDEVEVIAADPDIWQHNFS